MLFIAALNFLPSHCRGWISFLLGRRVRQLLNAKCAAGHRFIFFQIYVCTGLPLMAVLRKIHWRSASLFLQVSDVGSEKLFSPTTPKGKSPLSLLSVSFTPFRTTGLWVQMSSALIPQLFFRFKCQQTLTRSGDYICIHFCLFAESRFLDDPSKGLALLHIGSLEGI